VPHRAIQRKLPDHHGPVQNLGQQVVAGDQDAQGDGQIICRALFPDRSRGQVDDQALAWVAQAGVPHRRFHPLAALPDGGIRQPDDIHSWKSIGRIYFDVDDHPL
jgi:hypothetical protein